MNREMKELKEQMKQLKRQTKEDAFLEKKAKKERRRSAAKKGAAGSDAKQTKSEKPTKTILEAFPVRDFEDGVFLLKDRSILDFLQVVGKSFYRASDTEVENMVLEFSMFLRKFDGNLKLIALNYPTNTQRQQMFLQEKLQKPELAQYYHLLDAKTASLAYLEQNQTDREVYLMVFAKNQKQYRMQIEAIAAQGAFQVAEVDDEKKVNILFQLGNMNQKVKA